MTHQRKWIVGIGILLLSAAGILLFYEREDPAKWAIGKWVETQHGLTADISAGQARVASKDERRQYAFTYTIDTWQSPYEVSFYRGGNLSGTALVKFEGKDKVIVKKKPVQGEDDLSKAVNDFASVWLRVKE